MTVKSETAQFKLEEGVGRLQDGAEGLFSQAGGGNEASDKFPFADAVRDVVVDRPFVSLAAAAFIVFFTGRLLHRR
ncbi:hypothetical protein [Acetobacter thailandicus]|uniref:hypothetical protein n=1 Tax=Acetobacter thailandicus TaxID=1502842 RepID=UPI001BA9E35C|nr:hypothetical protein [Acetobacter thailandicus]MBS0985620.1 hypothetical protein [Acetobacter thailandicus]